MLRKAQLLFSLPTLNLTKLSLTKLDHIKLYLTKLSVTKLSLTRLSLCTPQLALYLHNLKIARLQNDIHSLELKLFRNKWETPPPTVAISVPFKQQPRFFIATARKSRA